MSASYIKKTIGRIDSDDDFSDQDVPGALPNPFNQQVMVNSVYIDANGQPVVNQVAMDSIQPQADPVSQPFSFDQNFQQNPLPSSTANDMSEYQQLGNNEQLANQAPQPVQENPQPSAQSMQQPDQQFQVISDQNSSQSSLANQNIQNNQQMQQQLPQQVQANQNQPPQNYNVENQQQFGQNYEQQVAIQQNQNFNNQNQLQQVQNQPQKNNQQIPQSYQNSQGPQPPPPLQQNYMHSDNVQNNQAPLHYQQNIGQQIQNQKVINNYQAQNASQQQNYPQAQPAFQQQNMQPNGYQAVQRPINTPFNNNPQNNFQNQQNQNAQTILPQSPVHVNMANGQNIQFAGISPQYQSYQQQQVNQRYGNYTENPNSGSMNGGLEMQYQIQMQFGQYNAQNRVNILPNQLQITETPSVPEVSSNIPLRYRDLQPYQLTNDLIKQIYHAGVKKTEISFFKLCWKLSHNTKIAKCFKNEAPFRNQLDPLFITLAYCYLMNYIIAGDTTIVDQVLSCNEGPTQKYLNNMNSLQSRTLKEFFQGLKYFQEEFETELGLKFLTERVTFQMELQVALVQFGKNCLADNLGSVSVQLQNDIQKQTVEKNFWEKIKEQVICNQVSREFLAKASESLQHEFQKVMSECQNQNQNILEQIEIKQRNASDNIESCKRLRELNEEVSTLVTNNALQNFDNINLIVDSCMKLFEKNKLEISILTPNQKIIEHFELLTSSECKDPFKIYCAHDATWLLFGGNQADTLLKIFISAMDLSNLNLPLQIHADTYRYYKDSIESRVKKEQQKQEIDQAETLEKEIVIDIEDQEKGFLTKVQRFSQQIHPMSPNSMNLDELSREMSVIQQKKSKFDAFNKVINLKTRTALNNMLNAFTQLQQTIKQIQNQRNGNYPQHVVNNNQRDRSPTPTRYPLGLMHNHSNQNLRNVDRPKSPNFVANVSPGYQQSPINQRQNLYQNQQQVNQQPPGSLVIGNLQPNQVSPEQLRSWQSTQQNQSMQQQLNQWNQSTPNFQQQQLNITRNQMILGQSQPPFAQMPYPGQAPIQPPFNNQMNQMQRGFPQ